MSDRKLRIAHLSDSHFSEDIRLDDCAKVHTEFVAAARAAGCHLVVHGGDVFERRSTPAERSAFAEFLSAVEQHGMRYVGVRGNHDAPGDLELFDDYVVGDEGTIAGADGQPRDPIDCSLMFPLGGAAVHVYTWPWIERSWYAHAASSPDDVARELGRRLLATQEEYVREADGDRVIPILVAHLEIAGYETEAGHQPAGATMAIAPAAFERDGCELLRYVALGHIHKHQTWSHGRVVYSGSPQRNNFGEPEAKGWVFVEIDLDQAAGPGMPLPLVEFRELGARQMKLLEVTPTDDQNLAEYFRDEAGQPSIVAEGDVVRLRLRVKSTEVSKFDRAEIERRLVAMGAREAKVELVVEGEDRVRSAEIKTAVTAWDKLRAYFTAAGIAPDDQQVDRLRTKLDAIEQEV